MNNSPQIIKISELTPSIKGQYLLLFEVAEILPKKPSDQHLTCRIVDQTGIITAYFNQYTKFITKGSVFELVNLRCNVVDHHLRLQMIKESQLCKKPLKIGFKDMENDLSVKFYVQVKKKNQGQKIESQKEKEKIQSSDEKEKKLNKKEKPTESKKQQRPQQNGQSKQKKTIKKQTQKPKQKIEYIQKKVQKQSNFQEKQQKKKYVEKGSEQSAKEQNPKDYRQSRQQYRQKKVKKIYKPKDQNEKSSIKKQIPNINLKQIHQFPEEPVNLFAKVLTRKITKQNYFLCKVADGTGAIFIQFSPKTHLQEGEWYHFNNFMIYGDKRYDYIAAQLQSSSIQLQQDYNDKAEHKFIYKKP